MNKRPYELPDDVPGDDERTPTEPPTSTPPERPSAKRYALEHKPQPSEWSTPIPKPALSAPRASPHPETRERITAKANEIEDELAPDWQNKTNPGAYSTNAYTKRKAKLYALIGAAVAIGIQLFDHTVPMLFDLYEKHLDRQAQRAAMKAGP